MSNTGLYSDQDRVLHHNKKSTHRRNNSGELDVFEAAGYFSGSTEYSTFNGAIFTQKGMSNSTNEQRQGVAFGAGGRRMSLDMPTRIINQLPSRSPRIDKQIKEKKYKQPSSPGGKLASFLNSLFNQNSSKKKKSSKSSTTQSMKDEEDSPGGMRRKRRSSISHFPSYNTKSTDSPKSVLYSSASSVSGFRTPPPFTSTTTSRFQKDLRSDSDHHQREVGFSSKLKLENGFSEKSKKLLEKERILVKDEIPAASTENKKKEDVMISSRRVVDYAFEVDEGGESDSSSDLFELQNYDIGNVYSSTADLPVYETTHMETCINRGAPISNGPL